MIAVFVNTAAVLVGSFIGLLCKRGIPNKMVEAVMLGLGLCTVYIGISGALSGENTLVLIISMVLGAILGTALDLDQKLNRMGTWIETKFPAQSDGSNVALAFVTSSLLFCIGAMTFVGALNAGLTGDYEMLFTKAVLDLVSSAMLAASLGFGVIFAAIFVFLFEGAIVLFAQFLAPILIDAVIAEITCVGSVIILALGVNLIGITKIKVTNYLPAIFFAPFIYWGLEKVMAAIA